MPELLEISDIEGSVGKILYVLEDDEQVINACFYHNEDEITDDEISAEFDGICEDDELERVGSVDVDDEEGWLRYIEVNEDYRRMGIGSTLIRLAIDHLGLTSIACVQENEAYEYDLTGDGERLIAYCVREGIITPNMCHFAHGVLLAEDASGDPGQSSVMVMNAIPGGNNQAHNHGRYHFSEDELDNPYEDEPKYLGEDVPDYDEDELDDPYEGEPEWLGEDVPDYDEDELDNPYEGEPEWLGEDVPDYDEDELDNPDEDEPDYLDADMLHPGGNTPDNYDGNQLHQELGNLSLHQGQGSLKEEDEICIAASIQRTPSPLLSPAAFFKKESKNDNLLEKLQRKTPSPTNG